MFESCTKRERMGPAKLAAVVAVTAVAFAAQIALFVAAIGQPLATAIGSMRTAKPEVTAAAAPVRPELTEEILVVAPYRPKRLAVHARVAPWRPDMITADLEPASTALAYGYCPAAR